MAWTAPMTAVAGQVFTASQYNTHVRDNMLETGVAKATVPGSIIAGTGPNSVEQRTPAWSAATGGSTTTSTSYTDLDDAGGPSITVESGSIIAIWIFCNQYNTNGTAAWMSFAISGDTPISADDTWAVQLQGTDGDRNGAGFVFDGLSAGSNTITAKYRVSTAGTGYFSQRRLAVWPF
jgi:hypothetical protein